MGAFKSKHMLSVAAAHAPAAPAAAAGLQPDAFGVDIVIAMGTPLVDCTQFFLTQKGGGLPFVAREGCFLKTDEVTGTIYQVPFATTVPTDTATTATV
jgi:hypothetical protein